MRTRVEFPGIKNSQKIRVIINGFGMYMCVKDIRNICTGTHRAAINSAMCSLSADIVAGKKISGFGSNIVVYDAHMTPTRHDVQVDLVSE